MAVVVFSSVGSSVQALPAWALSLGESRCEYLEMGASWRNATIQAYRDNQIWDKEIEFAESTGLAAKTFMAATLDYCPEIATPIVKNSDGSWKPMSEIYAD